MRIGSVLKFITKATLRDQIKIAKHLHKHSPDVMRIYSMGPFERKFYTANIKRVS